MDREVYDSAIRKVVSFDDGNNSLAKFVLPRIVVEHLLGGLPMVNVPVDDKNFTGQFTSQHLLRSYGHVVEKTIAAVFGFHCVMPRWPDNRHSVLNFATTNALE